MRDPILVDCDGVLSDFVFGCETAARQMGFELDWDPSQYNVFHALNDRNKKQLMGYINRRGFVEELEPIPEALIGLAALRDAGYDLICVTAPWNGRYWERERKQWLRSHFGFRSKDVIQTHHKHLIRGKTLIDDKPSHCQAWGTTSGSPALLWDATYNREVDYEDDGAMNVIRVQSWDDVLAGLEAI